MDYKDISLKDLAKSSAQQEEVQLDVQKETEIIEEKVQELSPEDRKRVDDIKKEINLTDSSIAVEFGVGAQKHLSEFSATILSNVRNKDSGEIGELLTDLMGEIKSLDVDELGEKKGFLQNLPFFKETQKKVDNMMVRYDTVESSINKIESRLEQSRTGLVKDIVVFDQLYEKNLDYFKEIQYHIVAGEEVLRETRDEVIPRLRQEAIDSGEQMDAQLVKDFEDSLNRFEKKVHDLKLSKTMAIQVAPQIRLIQNNDKLLVDKIQTAILNTVPLWKSQMVIALGLQNQQAALQMQREVSDTTNELLRKNSEMLKQNTTGVLEESERGIIDLETLQQVNKDLIETIEQGIIIQREGRQKRILAEQELLKLEENLKQTLLRTMDDDRKIPLERN